MLRAMRRQASDAMLAAVAAMSFVESLVEDRPLSDQIPPSARSMTALTRLSVSNNSLRGPIPHAVGSLLKMLRVKMPQNRLSGPIPHAVGSMTRMVGFYINQNSLRGPIPDVVGSMIALNSIDLNNNMLSGSIPDAIGSLTALAAISVYLSSLCGPIPHAVGSMTALISVNLAENILHGPLPHAVGSMTELVSVNLAENALRGPLPHAVGSLTAMVHLGIHYNDLRGSLPHALHIPYLSFEANGNSFSGTIPAAILCIDKNPTHFPQFAASGSQLSGSIPDGIMTFKTVVVHGNRLTGTLPVFRDVRLLLASGNLLEGTLPSTPSRKLQVLDLSGVPGRSGGLNGPLPSALRQSSELEMVTLANQQMDGGIPSFTSTLSLLALHKNRLKVLPDIQLKDKALRTAILLHDNLLSCCVPACGNATVKTSIIAIGNRLCIPKGEFPAWVLEYEHDHLFWVTGTEGISLVQMISGAVGVFMCAVASKVGKGGLLRAMSSWRSGPTIHLWAVKALSHLDARMTMESLSAAVFFIFLLSWDLYACPQTLALASACLRTSGLIQTFVFLWWCKLSFHSLAVAHLTIKDKKEKKWPAKMLRRRLLLWSLWCALTLVLSTLAILYQVGKSIPGFLQVGTIASLGLKACIGSAQGLVANVIVPSLASKMRWQKHALTTVSSLLMSCLIPAVIIIYLDTGCLGEWVSLWKPCRSNRKLFEHRLVCTTYNVQDCTLQMAHLSNVDIMVVRPGDICDPHFAWSSNSMARCIHTSLLRLQEIWLTKFVTTGVLMPAIALLRNNLPTESGTIVGNVGIYMAYAMVSSGHLPLMNFILLLALLGEGLVARVAWDRGCLKAQYVQKVATPVVKIARLLSLMVHLASAAGDPRTLALASGYIFILIMSTCMGMSPIAQVFNDQQEHLEQSKGPIRIEGST